jgi:hypothetical protein
MVPDASVGKNSLIRSMLWSARDKVREGVRTLPTACDIALDASLETTGAKSSNALARSANAEARYSNLIVILEGS